eukprot:3194246-Alexandrium_andersonii.AAC.1
MAIERAKALELPAATTCFDMYKAFDQVNRVVVYALMLAAGVQVGTVVAYIRYLEALSIVPFYGPGVGKAVSR